MRRLRDRRGPQDVRTGHAARPRRTGFADAPEIDVDEIQQAMIEREPITVVLSEKGWIRALRGHLPGSTRR